MKTFIKKKWKILLPITVLLLAPAMFFGTSEIVAKIMPHLSEVTLVSYEIEQTVYPYSGQKVEPKVKEIVFLNEDEKEICKESSDIEVIAYTNNTKCGYADIEISVSGCRGTMVLSKVFKIEPKQVVGVRAVQEEKTSIMISWEEVYGATGYYIYKSLDSGANYSLLADCTDLNMLSYKDAEIQLNASYMYYVSAYVKDGEAIYEGPASESVIQYTPLETAVLTAVNSVSHNTNKVFWNIVPGAAGYQIYRSNSQSENYTCIAEILDGTTTSYNDATCECGKKYFYYIVASQIVNAETIYGDKSNIVQVTCLPNRVNLGGGTLDDSTKVNLSWQKSIGANGYQIFRSTNSNSNYTLVATISSADTLSWCESDLDKHSSYYYRIRPYRVEQSETLFGSYSGVYTKEAVIVYNYVGGTGADILRQHAGRPYTWGGVTPSGWDCSGFTQWVFRNHFGIELPRTAGEQASLGSGVSLNNRALWKPGDLIFYKEAGKISHVAVYLGNGEMIHALNSKYDTLIQSVDYYEKWDAKTSIYCVKRLF